MKGQKGVIYKYRAVWTIQKGQNEYRIYSVIKNPGAQDFENFVYPVLYCYVYKAATEIIFLGSFKEGHKEPGFFIPLMEYD